MSAFEDEVLRIVRKELKRAMRMKCALTVTIDPWLMEDGAYIFAGPNPQGRSYTVQGDGRSTKPRKTRKR